MNDYSQPEFYRFNEDSILLVKFIQDLDLSPLNILDLGAGCGVIGIELARSLMPSHLALVEAQSDYLPHLQKNIELFLPPKVSSQVIISSFGEFQSVSRYDLIVANPPYYLPGHGRPSPDSRRAIARSFLLDDWRFFLNLINLTLSNQGWAYVIIKNDLVVLDLIKLNLQQLKLKIHKQNQCLILEFRRFE
jgi:tRNA1Val (adenine37-N6)-methyltransferase